MSLEKIAYAIEKIAKEEQERSKSLGGRIARGLGTFMGTGLGAGLGAGAGAALGAVPVAMLGGRGAAVGTGIAGGLIGGALGGKGVYDVAKYKKNESARKYRGMQGFGLGSLVGAAPGLSAAIPLGAIGGAIYGNSEDKKHRKNK